MEVAIKLILMALIPSFAMWLTLPLWYWRKVHNNMISFLAVVLFIAPFVGIWFGMEKHWLAILLMAIIIIPNLFGFKFFMKRLNLNRCPECHAMGVSIVDHDRETIRTTTTTTWSDGSKTRKHSDDVTNYYTLQCDECGYARYWNDGGKD